MGRNTYRDWIPEGEDTGAQGSVLQDFVPDKIEVAPIVVPKEQQSQPKVEEGEVVKEFKCDECGKVLKNALGLSGHKRSHKPKV